MTNTKFLSNNNDLVKALRSRGMELFEPMGASGFYQLFKGKELLRGFDAGKGRLSAFREIEKYLVWYDAQ